jgi:hypothetical protein
MAIKAIIVRGEFTQDEFNRVVAVVREIDTRPGRTLHVMAIDPDGSMEDGRRVLEEALPPMPGRARGYDA